MPEWTQAMKSRSLKYFLCTTARIASSYLSPTSLLGQGTLTFFYEFGLHRKKKSWPAC